MENEFCKTGKQATVSCLSGLPKQTGLPVKQALKIMKITAILLFTASLHVSAEGFSQKVNLQVKDASLEQVFGQLQKQTGFSFIWDENVLKQTKPVTANIKNASIETVLDICLKDQPVSYSIIQNMVVIKSKKDKIVLIEKDVSPPIDVKGRVVNENGEPVAGASVMVKGTNQGTNTNNDGYFALRNVDEGATLVISSVNIVALEIKVEGRIDIGTVRTRVKVTEEDILVVSTGYQDIPKERATGSFFKVDNQLFNRRTSDNILERLEDIVPGLIFNRDRSDLPENDITIRGNSTIYANTQPLIVVDNFPYDGQIEQINPNDVESITVLRDAASASIWGAKAGNGVIIITTKKARIGAPRINFNSNFTIKQKPDLFYEPLIDISDFIELERQFFDEGRYNSSENSSQKTVLPPVIETLIQMRDGLITIDEGNHRIEEYKKNDVRRDIENYFYRPAIYQQYALNVSGGNSFNRYLVSGGFDKSRSTLIGNSDYRLTLNAQNNFNFLNNKLNIGIGIYLSKSLQKITTESPSLGNTMYWDLIDEQGNVSAIPRYRETFLNQAENAGLLDWHYYPVNEIGLLDKKNKLIDYRINTSLSYKFTPAFRAELLYQYWNSQNENTQLYPFESYYSRDLINTFTQKLPGGGLQQAIPEGGVFDFVTNSYNSHSLRTQLHFNRNWNNDNHSITALAGTELKDFQSVGNSTRYYGYDDKLGLSYPVDFVTRYRRYSNNFLTTIASNNSHSGLIDRFLSYYANVAYTLKNKYTISGSARKDMSNIFGVRTNQQGVPLWSAGLSWDISKESFYHVSALPYLKFRITYGYNGNVDKSISAYTTAIHRAAGYNSLAGLPYVQLRNPGNPELRWERIYIVNASIEFKTKNDRISGNFEVYNKAGLDLIGDQVFPSSSGVNSFRGNFANTRARGFDISIQTNNLQGLFKWQTHILFSHVKEKVTNYALEASSLSYLNYGAGKSGFLGKPRKDYPIHAIYSYAWAGLDFQTGDPMGYHNGSPSKDYLAIRRDQTLNDLVYHGSGRPTTFGAIRNDFAWKAFALSLNFSYRLGYFFRRESVNYSTLINPRTIPHSDYYKRWQNQGDEAITVIPSMPKVSNSNREEFYRLSSVLVEPGDHIRLQDVRFSYNIFSTRGKYYKNAELYIYANNLGILWKASKEVIDPDFRTSPAVRSIAAGVQVNF